MSPCRGLTIVPPAVSQPKEKPSMSVSAAPAPGHIVSAASPAAAAKALAPTRYRTVCTSLSARLDRAMPKEHRNMRPV